MNLTALSERDPRLRQICEPIMRRQLLLKRQQVEIDELLDYVYGRGNKTVGAEARDASRPGTVGLSANQVGIMKQISIVDLSIGRRGYYDLQVLINPRIVWRSKTRVRKVEGCVNFATIWGTTQRSQTVRVEAMDRSGNELTLKLTGWAAVLLQHEVDHLNGHLFIDRLVDPSRADAVEAAQYEAYRQAKADWEFKVDVTDRVVLEVD